MTIWTVTTKPSYMSDFIELPRDRQQRIVAAVDELETDPVTPRGNTIKPLQGWDNLWRYRLGDYRLIYSAVPEARVIALLAIGPRKDVYERFNYRPGADPAANRTFSPDLAARLQPRAKAAPAWQQHPEWFEQQTEDSAVSTQLPRELAPRLLERWLIPAQYHAILQQCVTEDDLMACDLPDTVLEQVMGGLWPSTVEQIAAQPSYRLFRPEDLEEYAAGTLRTFLLHLDDQQQRFTDWALRGPTLLKGGPGSGKSTVALYRIRALMERALTEDEPIPSILFVTYTNALTSFSESLLKQLLADLLPAAGQGRVPESIKVTTLDKVATRVARRDAYEPKLAGRPQLLEALMGARNAISAAAGDDLQRRRLTSALLDLSDDYLIEEIHDIIEGQDCRSEADYLAASRAGRSVPLRAPLRQIMWALYEAWRRLLYNAGHCTWGQLRQAALDAARGKRAERYWDYVVVDEAQDLTAAALALCVELCREPAGLFLTADANQSIYQRGFRWQGVHDQLKVVGRTRILRRNYRTTREIMDAANQIVAGLDNSDRESTEQIFVKRGARPAIYASTGAADQARWLAGQISAAARELHLPISAAAILVPSNSLGPPLADQLSNLGLPATFMRSSELNLGERSVKIMTLHAAKGLEFPIVAVAHVEAGRLPREILARGGSMLEEHLSGQRRLFYVGCTRAMRHLFVTYDQALPSQFLGFLNSDMWITTDTTAELVRQQ